MTWPTTLAAARLRLVTDRPYLASALWALHPVERPGLGTLAVDRWGRLYYDPAVATAWSVDQLAGVIYHEVCHLLRDHHRRAEAIAAAPVPWNLAADAEINDDIIVEGVTLPDNPVTPAALGQPSGRLAEEYYAALAQAQQPAPQQGGPSQPSQGAQGRRDQQAEAGPDSGQGEAGGAPPAAGGAADAGEEAAAAQPTTGGPSQQATGGDASDSPAGSAAGSIPAALSPQSDAASTPPAAPSPAGSAAGTEATGAAGSAAAQTPAPAAGRCGSCAHGHQEPWEEPPPGTPGAPPGLSQAEATLVRRQVAEAIRQAASRSRGTTPGHWARWADAVLEPPRVDWRRELASLVRRTLADAIGASDYTYRRPSRRQGQVGNGRVILPALRQPVPQVAVVVDTSGSMGDRELSGALREVAGILRACGQREPVAVIACDAAVAAVGRVYRPEQVRRLLKGGGGTDMGAGLAAAAALQPRPQVCVVITDGYTPWPPVPPRGMAVVVCLVGGGSAPDWARTVKVEG